MKKKLTAVLVVSILAVGITLVCQYSLTRHPMIEEAGNGWAFTYDLCVPQVPPNVCQKQRFKLVVPKGTIAEGMPYVQRPIDIETVEQARIEAEARADMIENIHKTFTLPLKLSLNLNKF